MKFEGSLSKFFPPDLLMFLANMGKEGLLTVHHQDDFLTIFFKDGSVADAQSRLADDKILKALFVRKRIDSNTYRKIMALRKETGIGVMAILERLNLFPMESIDDFVVAGIREVIFQFFLLKNGHFDFSSIHVDSSRSTGTLLPQTLAMEIARWVDEWHDIERAFTTFDRKVAVIDPDSEAREPDIRMVYGLMRDGKTIREILNLSPMPSFTTLKIVEKAVTNSWAVLQPREKSGETAPGLTGHATVFHSFRQTFKKILSTSDSLQKIKGLIDFCKDHFDLTFIISATPDKLLRCVVFYKNEQGSLKSREIRNVGHVMDEDPVFSRVYSSGFSFFGTVFQTAIIKDLYPLPEKGECAIIHMGRKGERANLIFTVSGEGEGALSPFHYLELLSWLINPDAEPFTATSAQASPPTDHRSGPEDAPKPGKDLAKLVHDLPPMPHLASHMLQILSDPDSSVDDLTKILVQDQAMVATLIKVSNSALYRTGHEIITLNDAVGKLGFKAIRSLVLTATTHSLFPKNNARLEVMSHSLWQHSKECGLASRIVAEISGYSDPDEAFVAGLLHDIGKLAILLTYTAEYQEILRKQSVDGYSSLKAEKAILGFDHREIGARLMEKWHMPLHLSESVTGHHLPSDMTTSNPLTLVVALGNLFSHLYGAHIDDRLANDPSVLSPVLNALKLTEENQQLLHDRVVEDFKQSDVFD